MVNILEEHEQLSALLIIWCVLWIRADVLSRIHEQHPDLAVDHHDEV